MLKSLLRQNSRIEIQNKGGKRKLKELVSRLDGLSPKAVSQILIPFDKACPEFIEGLRATNINLMLSLPKHVFYIIHLGNNFLISDYQTISVFCRH